MDFFFSRAHSNILERLMLKTHPGTLSQRYQRTWHMWFVNQTFVSPQANMCPLCSEAMHLPSTVCTHFLLIHGTDRGQLMYLTHSHTKQVQVTSTPCRGLFKVRLQVPHVPRAWTTPWCWFVMQNSPASQLCLHSTQTAIPWGYSEI